MDLQDGELRLALEAGALGAWTWDLETGPVVVSPGERRSIEPAPGDAGRETSSGLAPDDLAPDDLAPDDLRRCLEGHAGHGAELRLLLPGGCVTWLLGRGRLLLGPGGPPARARGDASARVRADAALEREVEERRWIENALAAAGARTRAILDAVPDAIVTLDPAGRIETANPAACRLFGAGPGQLAGRALADLLVPRAALDGAAAREVCAARLDGERVPVEVTRADLPPGAAVVVLRDLRERRRAEAALRASEERLREHERLASLGTLAAGVAHELNNPVGAMLLAAECGLEALDASEPLAEVAHCLRDVAADAHRCRQIVSTVLRFARPRRGERPATEVAGVIRAALSRLQRDPEVGGRFELHLPPAGALVLADPDELEQALFNLLRNAAQASGPGADVQGQVAVACAGARVRIAVADHGPGMSEDVRRRVFEPFFTTRRDRGGTGLGLSLSHGIVAAHGGAIEVDSAPGRGTTFTVILPRAGGSTGGDGS